MGPKGKTGAEQPASTVLLVQGGVCSSILGPLGHVTTNISNLSPRSPGDQKSRVDVQQRSLGGSTLLPLQRLVAPDPPGHVAASLSLCFVFT